MKNIDINFQYENRHKETLIIKSLQNHYATTSEFLNSISKHNASFGMFDTTCRFSFCFCWEKTTSHSLRGNFAHTNYCVSPLVQDPFIVFVTIFFSISISMTVYTLIYQLADDFGWQNADWHKSKDNTDPPATPVMSKLIEEGIDLDQHYAFKFCAASRSAIQSGRNPIHVNVQNYGPAIWDYTNPDGDRNEIVSGMPLNITTMGKLMKDAGYSTHFFGKVSSQLGGVSI